MEMTPEEYRRDMILNIAVQNMTAVLGSGRQIDPETLPAQCAMLAEGLVDCVENLPMEEPTSGH